MPFELLKTSFVFLQYTILLFAILEASLTYGELKYRKVNSDIEKNQTQYISILFDDKKTGCVMISFSK